MKTLANTTKNIDNNTRRKSFGKNTISKLEHGNQNPQFDYLRDVHISELDNIANNTADTLQSVANPKDEEQLIQTKPNNNAGLPDQLKTEIENLSGDSIDDVKGHHNSDKPAHLQADAQRTDIHLTSDKEMHLPQEMWHVVQQKQGRANPTMLMKGKVNINDDIGLEKEADLMGNEALQLKSQANMSKLRKSVKIAAPALNFKTIQTSNLVSSPVVQLYENLEEVYSGKEFENKNAWLVRFRKAQELLTDQVFVDRCLKSLTDWMVEKNRSLSQALSDFEEGIWSGDKLVLTDFVPPPVFLQLLRDGKLFEDLVGKIHGVHSHRIQWFILQYELGSEETLALFKEAGEERWMMKGKSMWDRIVDATGNKVVTDFTQPSHLENYINERYNLLLKHLPEERLNKELHEVHEAQPELKTKISLRYPSEDEFPEELVLAKGQHQELIEQRIHEPENSKEIDEQKIAIVERITNTKITTHQLLIMLFKPLNGQAGLIKQVAKGQQMLKPILFLPLDGYSIVR